MGIDAEIRRCNINQNGITGITVFGGIESGLVERSSIWANNQQDDVFGAGMLIMGNRIAVRENEFGDNKQFDVNVNGHNNVFIDNAIDCPFSIQPQGGMNNYYPVNNLDPHTNRAHRATC